MRDVSRGVIRNWNDPVLADDAGLAQIADAVRVDAEPIGQHRVGVFAQKGRWLDRRP